MSNPDSFLREVAEEVRRDRFYALLRRYGWIAALIVLLVVAGAAWNEWRKAQARAQAEAFGDAVVAALDGTDPAGRLAALDAVPADSPGRAAVVDMLRAAEAQRAGDTEAALAAFARVEARSDVPASYRQLAALKRVILAGPALDRDEREAVLAGLAQPDAPFRPLALEQMALLRLEAGEGDAALAILRELLDEPDVTPGLRARVQQLIIAIGGEPAQG